MATTWSEWISQATGEDSARQIATRIHRSHTSVSRWIRAGDPPADVVMAIARAYKADPLRGLIAAGWLTTEELIPHTRAHLRHVPLSFLLDELQDRGRGWEYATMGGRRFVPWFPMPPRRVDRLMN